MKRWGRQIVTVGTERERRRLSGHSPSGSILRDFRSEKQERFLSSSTLTLTWCDLGVDSPSRRESGRPAAESSAAGRSRRDCDSNRHRVAVVLRHDRSRFVVVLAIEVFSRRETDPAAAFLARLTEHHDLSEVELLVDSFGYRTVLSRLGLSGHVEYSGHNHIERW